MACLKLGPVSTAGLTNAGTWCCAISLNDLDECSGPLQFAGLWDEEQDPRSGQELCCTVRPHFRLRFSIGLRWKNSIKCC